tara:strand:- start:250 stop:525 length:276 start_codon:yes stop_codon:yes gene_type:complete
MIDTDRYEGYTPAPWKLLRLDNMIWTVGNLSLEWQEADKLLIADAPLLLEEVKRLRKAMNTMLDDMNNASPEEDIEYWLDTWKHWLKEMIK